MLLFFDIILYVHDQFEIVQSSYENVVYSVIFNSLTTSKKVLNIDQRSLRFSFQTFRVCHTIEFYTLLLLAERRLGLWNIHVTIDSAIRRDIIGYF